MPNGITNRQRLFVQEYLIDMNAAAAARRAGYAPVNSAQEGTRLLQKPHVQAAIDEALADRMKRTAIDQDWVISRLVEVAERCMQHEPVLDRKGKPTGEYTFNAMAAIKAVELLGKNNGMFKDKVEVTGKDGGPVQTEDVNATRDELARRIAGIAARIGADEGTHTTH